MGGAVSWCCLKREPADEKKLQAQQEAALLKDQSTEGKLEEKKEAGEADSKAWAVHLGAVTIKNDGVEVKPQMKVGAETNNFSTELGLSDVRDGIKVAAVAQAMVEACADGNSVPELHEKIRCDTVGFKQALEVAKSILCAGKEKASQLPKIAEVLGLDTTSLERVLGQRRVEAGHVTPRKESSSSSQRRDSAPVLYCSPPSTPVFRGSADPTTCIDGYVPTLVPLDCLPPGMLDGRWMSQKGEKILIERLDIMFLSGDSWTMTMDSPTHILVDVDGRELTAELDEDNHRLIWSDGDVWDFFGRVDVEEQAQRMEEELQNQTPCQNGSEPTMQTGQPSSSQTQLEHDDNSADPQLLHLRVEGSIGVGVSAEVRLGWADTQGYKMIGCGGKVAAGAGVGADVFAGKHRTETMAMIILGIGNFMFEYVFPLDKESKETA